MDEPPNENLALDPLVRGDKNEQPQAPQGWRARLPKLPTIVGLAAVAGVAITAWSVLGPKDSPQFTGRIRVLAVDRDVTLKTYLNDYLRRVSSSPSDYRRRRNAYLSTVPDDDRASRRGLLQLAGEVATIRTSVGGLDGRSVHVRWSLYDARRRRPLPGPSFNSVPLVNVRPEATSDSTGEVVWLPPPPGSGRYFIRMALYDSRNVLLDIDDSDPFLGG
jgi:hypothetical protein